MTTHHPLNQQKPGLMTGVPPGSWPRYLNIALAAWLFVSAFAWPHGYVMRTNTWIVAVLMFGVALWAVRSPGLRFVNAVLAGWLFFSSVAMYAFSATMWNNLIVSIVIFLVSLVPSGASPKGASTRARL